MKKSRKTLNSMEARAKKFIEPCAYIDSKPAYIGDVIQLKQYNETDETYDITLEKLIIENHRFVINHHFGIKNQTLAVCLLSTSEYLNKTKQLGIKLTGVYNQYKDVYMDGTRCWIIPAKCTKSIGYKLNENDRVRCVFNWMNNYAGNMKVIKGVIYNDLVNNQFSKYQEWFNTNEENNAKNCKMAYSLANYINRLSDAELNQYIQSQPEELVNDAKVSILLERRAKNKPIIITQPLLCLNEPKFEFAPDREILEEMVINLMFHNSDFLKIDKLESRGY